MGYYIITFIIQLVLLLGYFKIANQFNIVDPPNNRSSHSKATIRGGGIIFPVSVLLWSVFTQITNFYILGALVLIASVSFYDDIKSLSFKTRIMAQLLALTLLFWQLQIFNLPWYFIILIYLISTGWINAFNFMDGINGITSLYALVVLGTLAWLNTSLVFVSNQLILTLIFSVIIFSVFNVRKNAKTFAGDIGSVSLAFILTWFTILLIQKTGRIEYILFFTVYGIDSTITILYRLRRKENIFTAHRTHLYQYLSNELKWSHLRVAWLYAAIQLIINLVTLKLVSLEILSFPILVVILLILSILYLFVRSKIISALQPNL